MPSGRPPARENSDCPRFIALTFDGEMIEADNDLSAILKSLAGTFDADADAAEELVVWADGERVAAVMRSNGNFVVLEPGGEEIMAAIDRRPNGAPKRRRC